jgi:diguanylate cyclase (GGDEF)-like protein
LAVVLCDIDHFKNINDTYGHQAGDRVLRNLATLLMGELRRDVDWVARYGGEEFLIVLPETELVDAIAVAEKIRLSVASHSFDFLGVTINVTASFGVARYIADSSMDDTAVDALIADADACLYRSKDAGRNRVTA